MNGALSIAGKDLKRSLRDRSALAVSLVAPLLLAVILSAVIPEDELDLTFGLVDEDRGAISQTFRRDVLGHLESDGTAEIVVLESRAEAIQRAEDDEIAAAFVFPSGFSTSVLHGEPRTVEVVTNPASTVGAPIARSVADGFTAELNGIGLSAATLVAVSGNAPSRALTERVRGLTQEIGSMITVAEHESSSGGFDDDTFFPAGMAVFFLFFTTQFGAVSLLRERREGTLLRLLAAPLPRSSIILGKALFTFVLGVGSLTVLIVASHFLLGATWGNPLGVAAIVVAAVFAAMGVQSLVTTLATTDEQAAGYASVIAVTLGLLGGTFFPLSQAPDLVANLSYLTPHAWIMRGFGDLSGEAGALSDIAPSLGALLAFGAITGSIALLRSRRLVAA
ncbi:MAG: ABC transporter permease [Actinomycetota bacterium]|nr:ABC transporter permease [Actinomycetota bacterium]